MLTDKLTIRLTPNQAQVLTELRDKLGVSYSLMLRTIVSDFLTRNEDTLERIITGQQIINLDEIEDYATYPETDTETEDYFS